MRKFSGIIILVLISVLALFSCTNDEVKAPDGLQIISISEHGGYQLFGPEGWIVANDGDVCASYVASSGVVKASLNFAKTDVPEGTLKEYFYTQKALFPYEITIKEEPTTIKLGNADGESYAVVYTFNYNDISYASMQVLAKNAGELYIFTYTAEGDPTNEGSYYQRYAELINLSAKSVKFTEKSGNEPTFDGDASDDGYKLSSDKDISGFELYLPESYAVITSDAHVSAKISDKANIFISKAIDTNVYFPQYIMNRKQELSKIADNVTDIKCSLKVQYNPESPAFKDWDKTMTVTPTYEENLVFGNLDNNMIITYEYTYEVAGIKYHVYQVMGIKSGLGGTGIGAAGYVFTYTATEDEYSKNLLEIQDILKRIKF